MVGICRWQGHAGNRTMKTKLKLAVKGLVSPFLNQKLTRYKSRQTCKESFVATVKPTEAGVDIFAGPASFKMRVVDGDWVEPEVYDFAIFGLAALSLSNGWKITAEMPVSTSMIKKVDEITNVYKLWSIDKLSKLRIDLPIAGTEGLSSRGLGRLVCLSGGVDSTFAAICAHEAGDLDGCLLIAGADYPDASHKGFIELRKRVSAIASAFGSKLTTVETTIRQSRFEWEMMHGFNLASCLHYLSGTYKSGGIGLDNTLAQDVVRNPWGNNAALPYLFSTDRFSIKGFGEFANRVSKIKKIHEFDSSLFDTMSICWANITIGGNCGHCRKCIGMRLALFALGISDKSMFVSHPDLIDAIDHLKVSNSLSAVKGQLVRTAEIVDALPDGPVRSRLSEFERAVRHRYFLLDPFR